MKQRHALLLVTLAVMINGCSLFQPDDKASSGSEEDQADCEWKPVRGVAQLMRIEDNTAVMDFFPGDIRFRTPAEDGWQRGDEFKTLLETADETGCGDPRVRELKPIGPDA